MNTAEKEEIELKKLDLERILKSYRERCSTLVCYSTKVVAFEGGTLADIACDDLNRYTNYVIVDKVEFDSYELFFIAKLLKKLFNEASKLRIVFEDYDEFELHLHESLKNFACEMIDTINEKDIFLNTNEGFDNKASLNTICKSLKSIFSSRADVNKDLGVGLKNRTQEENKTLFEYVEFLYAFGDAVEKQYKTTDISMLEVGVGAWKTAINLQMYWKAFKTKKYITDESSYEKYLAKIKQYEPTYIQPKLKGALGIWWSGIDKRDL